MTPLIGKTLTELENLIADYRQPKFRAKQIAEWLYAKRATTIEEMTNLPKAFREELSATHSVGLTPPAVTQHSKDGTEKYLFHLRQQPQLAFETVYIPDGDRATLCVSSQVGCKMNCTFCATGEMGWQANLTAADIINQVLSVPHSSQLTNIVFMGMGEPLDNFTEVQKAIEILTSDYGLAWSPKRITVSTIGVHGKFTQLLRDEQVHVAISIHNAIPSERLTLMPVEKAFPIASLIEELRHYDFSGQRRLSFEYIIFQGLNDTKRHADALVQLLRGLTCRVNLILYHALPDQPYLSPKREQVEEFCDYLNQQGLRTTIRRSRGQDISAACGMLSVEQK